MGADMVIQLFEHGGEKIHDVHDEWGNSQTAMREKTNLMWCRRNQE